MKNGARDCLLIMAMFLAMPSAAGVAQTQPPAATSAPAPAAALLKTEELDQLMAPIALYPDTLLASVLMASTYPLEVVEASRWVKDDKSLKGEALKTAADKKGWDESVKQLTATPSVLEMMNGKLDWTQKLGNAVLAQQTDVMDAVQRLRARAESQDKLQTTKQQKVSTQTQNNKKVIVIEPAEPNTIYVPYYDPAVVYGAWPYPDYPPYYYPPYAGYYAGAAIATGIAFGAGIAVGAWATRDRYWGGGVRWGDNNININRQTNINNINANNNWRHDPAHRQGVRYNNADVANRFGKGNDIRNGAQNRMDFRGKDGRQVINPDRNASNRPGADRPGAGDRPSAGNRPAAGNRPTAGNRPSTGDRTAGNRGDRPNAGQRLNAGQRPSAGQNRSRDNAFSHNQARQARAQSSRGHASLAGRSGGNPQFRAASINRGGANFSRGAGMQRGGGMRGGGRRR